MSTHTIGDMPSRKTHYVHRHCRAIKSGRKAKSPCTRNGKPGTVIKGHYSPKKHSKQHSAAARIQAVLRGRRSRKSGSKGKTRTVSPKHTAASKITAALRKFSARRAAQKKKAAKLAKALKQLA